MSTSEASSPEIAQRNGRGRGVVAIFAAVATIAVLLCIWASAASSMTVTQQFRAVAREFDAPAAQAADRVGSTSQCPLTLDQVAAALPLSSGIQERALTTGCVFYTGSEKDFAVGKQPVMLYVDQSKGRIDPQWLAGMGSRLCSLGTSRNAIGRTAFSLCGITPKQRERNELAGSALQRGLVFDFETPDHMFVWTVNVTYEAHQTGFRTQDPETGLLGVLKAFS